MTTVEEENSLLRKKVIPIFQKHRQKRIAAKKIARCVKTKLFKNHHNTKTGTPIVQGQLSDSFYKQNDAAAASINLKDKKAWDIYELRDKTREAHREMMKNDEEDDILLVEKCYVFMDVKKSERVLLCAALKQIIDLERRVSLSLLILLL